LPLVQVCPFTPDGDFVSESLVDCDPERALWAAWMLVTYAVKRKPELASPDKPDNLWALGIALELGELMQRVVEQRMRTDPPKGLIADLDARADWRHEENVTVTLLTARRVGLRSAQRLIQDLVIAASEPDATTRVQMLSGLVPDIARATAGLTER
jgi:hypothetical protein